MRNTVCIKLLVLLVLQIGLALPALAQDRRIGGYMALIGAEDLHNSRGMRLNDAGAIIAQDRANYPRFGLRHTMDQGDPWFTSRGHRMAIPSLVTMSSKTARIIVQQGALIAVSVYADPSGQMTRMVVEIPG